MNLAEPKRGVNASPNQEREESSTNELIDVL